MSDPASVSQYYRKKLEQHELTPEEWVAVRYAVIKHTTIGIVNYDDDCVDKCLLSKILIWLRMNSFCRQSLL